MTQHTTAADRTVVAVWEPSTDNARTIHPITWELFTVDTARAYAAGVDGAQILVARNGGGFQPVHRPRLAARIAGVARVADRIAARFGR